MTSEKKNYTILYAESHNLTTRCHNMTTRYHNFFRKEEIFLSFKISNKKIEPQTLNMLLNTHYKVMATCLNVIGWYALHQFNLLHHMWCIKTFSTMVWCTLPSAMVDGHAGTDLWVSFPWFQLGK